MCAPSWRAALAALTALAAQSKEGASLRTTAFAIPVRTVRTDEIAFRLVRAALGRAVRAHEIALWRGLASVRARRLVRWRRPSEPAADGGHCPGCEAVGGLGKVQAGMDRGMCAALKSAQ
jgi:hypothetical protein